MIPYNVYTYEHVSMGACSIQDALGVLKQEYKQQFLDNLETWNCIPGKGMDKQMCDLIKYSSFLFVRWIVRFLWVDIVFRDWM